MNGDAIRARLDAGETVLIVGCFDALSARLATAAGFRTLFLSGYCTAATQLGLPDFGYLTQTEMAEAARRVCATVPEAAVVVDGDTGYGNPLNTIRTVELYERAGAAGIFLEDQVWPKKCGHMAGKKVVPREDWLAKLRAAVDHRDRLFVTARTDARAAVGLEEACERARMAADLGVDAIFVEAPESPDEMETIAKATPGCVRVANMIEGGRTPLRTPAELHDLGFDLVTSPLTGLLAAARQMQRAFAVLYDRGTLRDNLDLVTSFDEFGAIVDLEQHYRLEARYGAGSSPEER
ncbi:MAG: isocitrate lyase/PEP mutase family protein [Actinomycetota bacterium]|nr:isocitrate lyase/PEP mutase family protein [Actinomycetota bacterium]